MIVAPPSAVGALQVTVSEPPVALADTSVGRPGNALGVCALTLVASSIESAAQAASRARRLIGGPLPAPLCLSAARTSRSRRA